MTTAEYEAYEKTVAEFFGREGIINLSRSEKNDWGVSFSCRPCECCRRPLGGDRINASGWNPVMRQVQEYEICLDCMYYAEYGQLDDMTMMSIEEE